MTRVHLPILPSTTLPSLPRKQLRRKKSAPNAVTLSARRTPKWKLNEIKADNAASAKELAAEFAKRPKTRGDCQNRALKCAFVSCRHHLKHEVDAQSGALKDSRPDVDVFGMQETCSLDLADRGEQTLERVGEVLNLTRERVRQIQDSAIEKVRSALARHVEGEKRSPVLYGNSSERREREERELLKAVEDIDDVGPSAWDPDVSGMAHVRRLGVPKTLHNARDVYMMPKIFGYGRIDAGSIDATGIVGGGYRVFTPKPR